MDIGIIGGGASGMILASMLDKHNVTLLERNNKLGKKLLLTGNGKCNFTNLSFENLDYIYNCNVAKELYKKYNNISFINYLHTLGIVAKVETHKNIKYVYPNNNKSTSVYYALLDKILQNNVIIKYDTKVLDVEKNNNKFNVKCSDNNKYIFDVLVFATGGASYIKTGSDGSAFNILKTIGHSISQIVPGLSPLSYEIEDVNLKKYNWTGFRVDANVKYINDNTVSESGEIQFTKENLSGIPILNLSNKISKKLVADNTKIDLHIDFSDALINFDKIVNDNFAFEGNNKYENRQYIVLICLLERQGQIGYKRMEDFLCGYLPDELNEILFDRLSLKNKKVKDLTKDDLINISNLITDFKVTIKNKLNFDNAQITIGGVRTDEVSADTLESKKIKNLYIIGEALDIDGICGGYNLQMAYSTATCVAEKLLNVKED